MFLVDAQPTAILFLNHGLKSNKDASSFYLVDFPVLMTQEAEVFNQTP